ncbi:alpha/beta fold hydrolase [Deinococcus pimensis]|uniref:alpha/beta fold hydrolase n=1 Tax=Deinococcus pimensis TaxID=309888 RepID=UPI0004865B9C|nr:alpha/beta hydrolase [Deinococcus pimensis]
MIREPHPILLHDAGASSHEWRAVAEDLGGVRPLHPDLPGFGTGADPGAVTPAMAARAVQEAVRSAGFERFVLVGHGLSALVARLVADDAPPGLVGVALVSPAPAPREGDWARVREAYGALRAAGTDVEAARGAYAPWGLADVPPGDQEFLLTDLGRVQPAAWDAWLGEDAWSGVPPLTALRGTPVLVIRGSRDPLSPATPEGVEECVVEGTSRLLPLTSPREVTRHLLHWTRTTLADVTRTASETRAKDHQ